MIGNFFLLRHISFPTIQVRTIGVQWLYEEEGNDEVINAHNSSDDAHAAKVEIASRIFRNYYCAFRANVDGGNGYYCGLLQREV